MIKTMIYLTILTNCLFPSEKERLNLKEMCVENIWENISNYCLGKSFTDSLVLNDKIDYLEKDYVFFENKKNAFDFCQSFINYILYNYPCKEFWQEYDYIRINNELGDDYNVKFLQNIRKHDIYMFLAEVYVNNRNNIEFDLDYKLDSLKNEFSSFDSLVLARITQDTIIYDDTINIFIPSNLEDAAKEIDNLWGDTYLDDILNKTLEEFVGDEHFNLSYTLRGRWHLWNWSRLFWWFNKQGIVDSPDDMTSVILKYYYLYKKTGKKPDEQELIKKQIEIINELKDLHKEFR